MRASALTGVAAAMTALAVVLSGCGSDTKTATESSSKSETSSKAEKSTTTSKKPKVTKTSEAPVAGPNPTIATYIQENNIQEVGIKIGDPEAPPVNLPVPEGWEPLAPEEAPEWAYGAIVYTAPVYEADPPNVIAIMSKLIGEVDPDRIIALAPGELQNLPDYDGGTGEESSLAEYPATVLGGTYTRDGATRFIAQKTVLIPAPDGLYVLQLNVDGPEDARDILNAATEAIDNETTIG